MKLRLLVLACVMSFGFTFSQSKTLWQPQSVNNLRLKPGKQDLPKSLTFGLDIQALKQALSAAPERSNNGSVSNVVLSFPNADGVFERFRIYEASVMVPELAQRYPEIRSYAGQGIDDPTAMIRFSVTPLGFQSMRLAAGKPATFIEVLTENDAVYTVFTRDQKLNKDDDFECSVSESVNNAMFSGNMAARNADDSILRTYRLAVSASGGYTQFHGGTVALALAAINQSMVRVNGIFEVDFSVRLLLIANTDDVIYTNQNTDPYNNNGSGLNGALQTTLTNVIGEANYDVGHLFATEAGNSGNAGCIGCVCVNNQKGSGWTSRTTPVGDPFDVDYVAHELGHQFGANHTWTFNGSEGTGVQVEPGSGTTIMSYAGITGPTTDVEPNVTPNFHAVSIEQVTNYIQNPLCEGQVATGNVAPVVNAGSNYTIPRGTPFILEGSATDADTPINQLTYVWEQIDDNGASTTLPSPTNSSGVAFRNYEPDGNPDRYFPRLETIKTGATSWTWEAVPNVARALNFRLTVRDNELNGGGNSSDDVALTVSGSAGPFVVNSPNTNVTWNEGSFATITWDVAGTTGNGVNAANVDIFLSSDGGDTYPIALATGVPNDGSHDIIVPSNIGSQNRVMVRGENHIFFDISDTNFTIAAPVSCTATVPTSLAATTVGFVSATLDWDPISAVIFDVQYREVGSGTWIDLSTSNNTIDLTGLSPLTDYEARVRSRCPDTSTSAYTSIITFTTTDIPPCTGTQITSYPYLETFDSGLGDWTQATGDDGDWILDAGGTPTGGTGPSDDVSGGGNYLYIEASTNGTPGEIGANATAILEGPCFDLTGITQAVLFFSYHAYGTDTGTLVAEISNDDGASWTSVFSVSGDQGDAWIQASIDLVPYLDQNIKVRFVGTTGPSFFSDIAIDHIGIADAPPVNYCASVGNTSFETEVTRVVFGTIDNQDGPLKDVGYEDFTNISTDVVQGTTVDLTVNVNTDGNFIVHVLVWIDWNENGSFTDPGEEYDLGDITNVFDGPLPTLPITIPESFNFGPTRMRVSTQYNTNPTPCLNNFDGEVEDYTVNVKYDGLLYSQGTWDPNAPDGTTAADNVLILDGTYNAATDISMNDILVNAGATINIPKEHNITVGGDITNNGEFILNSDSNEFSSLLVDGTVTGNLKYNRHVTSNAGGNDLIAPPVSGETFTSFITNNSNVFANNDQSIYLFGPFEKPLNEYDLYTSTEIATLDAGIGYRTASTDDGTFTFDGAVTNGTLNVPIVKTGLDFEKWNLVGNPYTSYIRLDTFLTENLSQLETQTVAIYGYDADNSNGSVWTIWNFSYSDANPNSLIAPGQAFFVSSPDGGSQVTFTPAMRSTGSSDDFIAGRNANFEHFIFRMEKTDGTRAYDTDIYIKDNMTMGLDVGYDAGIFQGDEPEPYMIYTQLSENGEPLDMAIQSIGFNDVNGTNIIPVGVNLLQGIQVEISMDASTTNYNIYLEDTELGIITLLNDSNYTFTSQTDMVGTGRFYLRFEAETLDLENSELDQLVVFSDTQKDQIVVKGQLSEATSFVLYDIQGRLIVQKDLDINETQNTIDTSNFSDGVYMVQLTSTTNSLSKKLIIR